MPHEENNNSKLAWIIIAFVAFSPSFMALSTWTLDNSITMGLYWIRFYAFPILLIEILTITYALIIGITLKILMERLPNYLKLLLLFLIINSFLSSTVFSENLQAGFFRYLITLTHLFFGFSIFHILRVSKFSSYNILWFALIAGSVSYVIIGVIYIYSISDIYSFDWLHFGLGVTNIRHAGFFVMTGAALSLGIAARANTKLTYSAAVFAATICVTEFFWSGSRAAILGLAAGTGLSGMLIPTLRTRKLIIASAITLSCSALISLINVPPHESYGLIRMINSANLENADAVSSHRISLWAGTFKLAMDLPFLGHGESQLYNKLPSPLEDIQHPHNAPLQIIYQWGFIGLILSSILLFTIWKKILLITRNINEDIAPPFILINSLIFYSINDGVFFFVYPVMIISFVIAACLAAPPKIEPVGLRVTD